MVCWKRHTRDGANANPEPCTDTSVPPDTYPVAGVTDVTTTGAVNWNGAAPWYSGPLSDTDTVAAPVVGRTGARHDMDVGDSQRAATTSPSPSSPSLVKRHRSAAVSTKLEPRRVTVVPPNSGADVGVAPTTTGSAR